MLMKYSCKSFFAVLIFIFVNLSISALTEADIISPVPGIWKNKQPLVISIANYHPDIEIYYTTSGSDPYQSGFAYDGPVLLEESGPVNLKIAAIDNTGKRQDFQISYRVQEEKNTEDSFIQSIISEPILSYIAGEEIKFPENYKYKIGFEKNTKTPFIDSKKISIPVESCTAEYIPVILSEDDLKTAKFRFVIHTTGKDTGSLSRKDVPFYITDWNFITFTNTNLIYSIDDSEWAGITGDNPKQIKIDRSIPHITEKAFFAYNSK